MFIRSADVAQLVEHWDTSQKFKGLNPATAWYWKKIEETNRMKNI